MASSCRRRARRVSAALTAWTLHHLGTNVSETVLTRPGQTLTTSGPYRFVRHPLYTAGLATLVAVGLTASNGFILSFTACSIVPFRTIIIPREESALITTFDNDYRHYRATTGALLPTSLR